MTLLVCPQDDSGHRNRVIDVEYSLIAQGTD